MVVLHGFMFGPFAAFHVVDLVSSLIYNVFLLLRSCFIDSLRTGWMNSGSKSFKGSRTKNLSLILG